jgi:tetratricopeptide (TPR) repeat protein
MKQTILFLSANPRSANPGGANPDQRRRALDQEASVIRKELKRSDHRDRFDLVTRWAAEPLDLLRELRELKPTVVHFCGPGGKDGLWFQTASGDPQAISPTAIAHTFEAAGGSVQLVVLSACYSEPAAEALLAYVDCVVGMPGALDDDMARVFAAGFYGALGDHESVAVAYEHGNAAISLEGLQVTDRPQLKVRAGADAAQIVLAEGPAHVALPCPYPGLAQFTPANRDLLFGRDKDRSELVQRIRAGHGRILVVGPSGSGKSSLIHAAVLPELAPADHLVQVVPRGGNLDAKLRETIDKLEVPDLGAAIDVYVTAIRGATDAEIEDARTVLRAVPVPDVRRRMIVVDPLEEIFAEHDPPARETLLGLLDGLWGLPWCTVILCMRADFYGALMVERCWRELEPCQYQVAPLDEAGLRAAIVEPALRTGVQVAPALVERLIREIDRDRSSVPLPLLQVALKELWAHMRWWCISLVDYERIVSRDQRGLAAVLAVHADAVLQRMTAPSDRIVAQRVLLDLVHLGEGRPHTRRRRALDDLRRSGDGPEQLERVVDALIEGRLISTGEDAASGESGRYVDLAHDTLITGWPALAGWIDERRADLRTQRRLEARAATDVVLTSAELPEFLRWLDPVASPGGQLLGASDALRALVHRSVVGRRRRRAAIGAGLMGIIAVAIVFVFQAERLRAEQAKTQQSIRAAMRTAEAIAFEFTEKLSTVACASASSTREMLLERTQKLLTELSQLGELKEDDKRTAMVGKRKEAHLAFERGHFDAALVLYQEVLADAQRRTAIDPNDRYQLHDIVLVYQDLGDVTARIGKLEEAQDWYHKALSTSEKLITADPDKLEWQREFSVSCNKLGNIAVSARKLDEAHRWYEKGFKVVEKLVAADPGNTEWQSDLSVSYSLLGDIAESSGKLDEARIWFDRALAVLMKLSSVEPNNSAWQRAISASYQRLGDNAMSADRLPDAQSWFAKGLDASEKLAAADPRNVDWQHGLSIFYLKLGEVAAHADKLDEARDWLEKSLAVMQSLMAMDPRNTELQRHLSMLYVRLGEVAMNAGKLDEARSWLEKDLAAVDKLVAADQTNTEWQHLLSQAYPRLGELAVRAGKLDEAQGWFDKALAVRQRLVAADPRNTEWQRDLSLSYEYLGGLAERTDNLDVARSWFEKDLALTQKLEAAELSNIAWQLRLAACYSKLGDLAKSGANLDEARAWFKKALAVRQSLATVDSGNVARQGELAASYDELGDIAMTGGAHAEARAWFDKALALRQKLVAADPSNTVLQRSLSQTYDGLATTAMQAARLNEARSWFDKAFTVRQKLVESDPSNTILQDDLSQSYTRLGNLAQRTGKLEEARGWFEKKVAVARRLSAMDPSNHRLQFNLCVDLIRLGLLSMARKSINASYYINEARSIHERLRRDGKYSNKAAAPLDQTFAELDKILRGERK